MSIRIQFKKRIFEISIGRKTDWFEQIYLISIEELFINNKEVYYATRLWSI